MPYAVFVSSRVTKDKKKPLIAALHGLDLKMKHQYVEVPGGDHGSVLTAGARIFPFFNAHSKSR